MIRSTQTAAMRGVMESLVAALAVTDPIDTLSAIKVEEAMLQVRAWLTIQDDSDGVAPGS